MLRAASFASAIVLAALLASAVVVAQSSHGPAASAAITTAVGDSARPEEDTKRDSDRHPALTLEFAGIKPGQKVLELAPGHGYYTRILSQVVGPKGKVYVIVGPKRPDAPKDAPEPAAAVQKIAADPHYPNVTVLVQKIKELDLPKGVDVVWTSQNYHDFHNVEGLDVVAFNKKILESLRAGGEYLVLDHAAAKGSGFRDTSTLHRIDAEAVKKEVESAGFKFSGSSDILLNSSDDHTLAVFDPKIKGHTDQFVLKFRKPGK
jgi:predicted methyltransferase